MCALDWVSGFVTGTFDWLPVSRLAKERVHAGGGGGGGHMPLPCE